MTSEHQPVEERVCSRCRQIEWPGEPTAPGGRAWCRRWDLPLPDPDVMGCLDFIPIEEVSAPSNSTA